MTNPVVNWTAHNAFSENTIQCRCGTTYRSHSKAWMHEGRILSMTRKPCPGCGATSGHVVRATSDVETMTISRPREDR